MREREDIAIICPISCGVMRCSVELAWTYSQVLHDVSFSIEEMNVPVCVRAREDSDMQHILRSIVSVTSTDVT